MEGNLNALGLILVILLTGVIAARYGTLTGSLRRAPLAFGIAFGVMVLASCFTTVFDDFEVDSSHQLLLPSACLLSLLILTRPGRIRTVVVLAVVLSTFVWSSQIPLLVGPNTRYTSNPEAARRSCCVTRAAHLRAIHSTLILIAEEDGNRKHPAGWITEAGLGREIPADYLRYTKAPSVEIQPFWHSALTGLYGKTYHELSLWYPGGQLKDALSHLEFRPR